MIQKSKKADFEEWLNLKGLAARTKESYLDYFDKLPQVITQKSINEFLVNHNHGMARATVTNYLHKFVKSKEAKEIEVPSISGRKKSRLPKYITKVEVDQLINSSNDELAIFLSLAFEGALRVSEVMKLRPIDFDMKEQTIRGVGKGNKEFKHKLTDKTMALVQNYIKEHKIRSEQQILPFHDRRQINYLLKKYSFDVLGKHVTPHQIKHSIAVHLRLNNVPLEVIQRFLKHENLNTTMVYAKVADKEVDKAWEKVFGGGDFGGED